METIIFIFFGFEFAGSKLDIDFESDTTWPHTCAAKQYGGLWGPHIEANNDLGHCAGALNQHLAWISSRPLSLDRWKSNLYRFTNSGYFKFHRYIMNDGWSGNRCLVNHGGITCMASGIIRPTPPACLPLQTWALRPLIPRMVKKTSKKVRAKLKKNKKEKKVAPLVKKTVSKSGRVQVSWTQEPKE